MELKSPKAKKKPRPMCWRRILRTPLLLLVLLGTSSCDHGDVDDVTDGDVIQRPGVFRAAGRVMHNSSDVMPSTRLRHISHSFGLGAFREGRRNSSDVTSDRFGGFKERPRLRHSRPNSSWDSLSDVKYLRRNLNREKINFVVYDELVDGETETRVHYDGVTAKETSVGGEG
ncbi:unnamed protein product, partial [Iphiclides podalirius]